MPKKILVVDDEPDNVEIFTRWLEKSQYEVITAFDGLSAIAKAQEEKPDLILMDIMMPVLDGYQVCEELKKDEKTADIPIIILTDAKEREFEVRAMKAGARAYVIKPHEPWPILRAIENVLRGQKSEPTRTEHQIT